MDAYITSYVGKMNRAKRMTALDPAGLHYGNIPAIVRLYKGYAKLTEVLYTNAFPGL